MNKNTIIAAVIMLITGAAAGYLLAPGGNMPADDTAAMSEAKKPIFYRNPMNPAITSPVPAQDEMGMDYIPVFADGGSEMAAGTVSIDPVTANNIGVRTVRAERKTLSRTIRSVGRVTFNEERVTRLHPKVEGWIEKLFIDKTGDRVKKDTMLLSIYSPQLMASEEEYLLALNNEETLKDSPFADIRDGAASLRRSARERLELFDVPAHQIAELEKSRKVMKNLHIHSPFDGIVMNIGAREGSRITPETELYMIADLSKVWVVADLYEDDMPWVREGDTAEMEVAGIPGRTFIGKVTYIYPYLEAKTRTIKIRLEFDNRDLELKPEMFANVTVKAGRQVDAVVVPSEAIVRTGASEQLFVKAPSGKFEPRMVSIGLSAEGESQILEGIEAGEEVVTSSQFLIDSESKLKEATAKMLHAGQEDGKTTETQMHDPWKSPAGDEGEMQGMEHMNHDSPPAHNHEPAAKMPMEHHHDHH
jgi:Cu(I)/Ag(I) efflux system membrane fusion protein